MTRTVRPHPALQRGQTLGFHTACPGTMSSSGTNRMSWFSGLPQLASVALVPAIAVSLMNERLSIRIPDASTTHVGGHRHQKWHVKQSIETLCSMWQFTQKPIV